MKLTITIRKEEFDKDGWLRAIKDTVEKVSSEAARMFAEAALPHIPVRTGFVSGAFGTLVELVGAEARFNPIITAVSSTLEMHRSPLNPTAEYYYGGGGRILKTPTSGQQYATPASDIFKWIGNNYTFTFNIDISYFKVNDQVSGFAPTAPWGAFQAGQVAYLDHIRSNLKDRLPKVGDFMRRGSVDRVGF